MRQILTVMLEDGRDDHKQRFPRAAALDVVRELIPVLTPACERIIVAGSLRRRKADVGDIELLYVPRLGLVRQGLFDGEQNMADLAIAELEKCCVLSRRTNVNGSEMFGQKNKLMRHTISGIPIDLFATTAEAWANYLVCRTGGAESNVHIAAAAKRQGMRWNPYGVGFTRLSDSQVLPVANEQDVFGIAGLPYLEPWERP